MLDYRKPYILVTKGINGKVTDNEIAEWDGRSRGLPAVAIKAEFGAKPDWDERHPRQKYLSYYDIGCERGHVLPGKLIEDLPDGIVFEWNDGHRDGVKPMFKLTEMTMEQFNTRVRPTLDEYQSNMLQTLDDVYVWYRRMVGIS